MGKKHPTFMRISMFFILILLSIDGFTSSGTNTVAEPVVDLDLLVPSTNPNRIQWSYLIGDNFGSIGFDVDHNLAGWDYIAPRTFAWEPDSDSQPNVIPTSADGGYDLFAGGLSGSMSYDPTYSYANTQFSASGDNFAHYNNQEVTDLCNKYEVELDSTVRAVYAKRIQAIIADEVPYIPIINTHSLWAFDEALSTKYTKNDWILISTGDVGDGWKSHTATTDTLVYAHTYELQEFTSFVALSHIADQYLAPVQIGLFERDPNDPNYARKPLIAADYPVWDSTKTVANVTLRQDVTFSNGHLLNATDVVNTYKMTLSPEVGSTSYATIKNFLKHTDGSGYQVDVKNSVYADGDWNVIFEFEQPYFDALSIMNLPIYDHQVIGTPEKPLGPAGNPYDFNSNGTKYSIGAGPFVLSQYSTISHNVRLTARDDYWNGPISLKAMEFNKYGEKAAALADLKAGNVDIIDTLAFLEVEEVKNVAGVDYVTFGDSGTQMLAVNMDHPVFGTGVDTPLGKSNPSRAAEAAKYVRLAMSHAIPREAIVNDVYNGKASASSSLWPENAEFYDKSQIPHVYDLDIARDYMSKAGYDIITHTGNPYIEFMRDGVLLNGSTDISSNSTTTPIFNLSFNYVTNTFLVTVVMIAIIQKRRNVILN